MLRKRTFLSIMILAVILLMTTDLLAGGKRHRRPKSTTITTKGTIDAENVLIQARSGRGRGNQSASDTIMVGSNQYASTGNSSAVTEIMGSLSKSGSQWGKGGTARQVIKNSVSGGGGSIVKTGPNEIAQGGGGETESLIVNTRSGGAGGQSAFSGTMLIGGQFSVTPTSVANTTIFIATGASATQMGRGVNQTQIVKSSASAGGGATVN